MLYVDLVLKLILLLLMQMLLLLLRGSHRGRKGRDLNFGLNLLNVRSLITVVLFGLLLFYIILVL